MGTNGALDTMAIDIPFDALKIKSGGDGLLDVAFLPDGKAWAWAAAGRSSPRMTPADRGPRTSPPMTCRRTCTRSNSSAIEGTSSARAASCSLPSDYEVRDNRDESDAPRRPGERRALGPGLVVRGAPYTRAAAGGNRSRMLRLTVASHAVQRPTTDQHGLMIMAERRPHEVSCDTSAPSVHYCCLT